MDSEANATSSEHPSKPPEVSPAVPRYSYYALSVLTLVNFLNYIDRPVLPAVAPSMRQELGLSPTEIGFMEDGLLLSVRFRPRFRWVSRSVTFLAECWRTSSVGEPHSRSSGCLV